MSVLPQQIPYNQYVADGITTTYVYNFLILQAASYAASDISVYVTLAGNAPNPANDIQVLNTAYTVTGVGNLTGGTIIFQMGYVPPASAIITIVRSMNFSISTDFSVAANFNGANLDAAFQRVVLQMQQLYADFVFTALQYPIDAYLPSRSSNILPILTTADNQVWMSQGGQIVVATVQTNPVVTTGHINTGLANQIAYYNGNGNTLSGTYTPSMQSILDSIQFLPVLSFYSAVGSVNYFEMLANTTGNQPIFQAVGSDTNIQMAIKGKGTGGVIVQGVSDGSATPSGYIGEVISAVEVYNGVSLSTGTAANVTLVALTQGTWRISSWVFFSPAASTTISGLQAGVNPTSATLGNPLAPDITMPINFSQQDVHTGSVATLVVPDAIVTLAADANYYLVAQANFGVSTMTVGGGIIAQRIA